jgi:hypothetical protein
VPRNAERRELPVRLRPLAYLRLERFSMTQTGRSIGSAQAPLPENEDCATFLVSTPFSTLFDDAMAGWNDRSSVGHGDVTLEKAGWRATLSRGGPSCSETEIFVCIERPPSQFEMGVALLELMGNTELPAVGSDNFLKIDVSEMNARRRFNIVWFVPPGERKRFELSLQRFGMKRQGSVWRDELYDAEFLKKDDRWPDRLWLNSRRQKAPKTFQICSGV